MFLLCIIMYINIKFGIIKMLQKESKITSIDNTGVKSFKCIQINAKKKKYGSIGDILHVIVKKFRIKKNMIKKQIYYGLVVSIKAPYYRSSGIFIKSDINKIVVLNKDNLQFMGTRIYNPIYKEIRNFTIGKKKLLKYEKIISLTKSLI